MSKVKMICFDMDGTIADLYGVENWFPKLHASNTEPYEIAEPLCDMIELVSILNQLRQKKIEIRVITWLAMSSTTDYKNRTRQAKREWLEKYNFPYDHFHATKYGATKASSVKRYLKDDETAILIDDNAKVRKGWSLGETIDPTTENIVEILRKLL